MRGVRRRDAPSRGGDRRLVRLGLDAVRPVPLPLRGGGAVRRALSAEFICEAIDQTRGWFYSLLAVSTLLFDTSSYRHCVCLGLILDPEGQKMSKSRGNVVEPDDVIDRHGADAFRWYYLTSQQPWAGYRFSVETVGEAVRQFMLTLWNTYCVLGAVRERRGARAEGFRRVGAPGSRAAASRSSGSVGALRLQGTVRWRPTRIEGVRLHRAGQAIAAYVDELSNWYVRLSRRRFWEGDRAAFATLRHCLLEVAALLAPFAPFLADEIHLNLAGGEGATRRAARLRPPRRLPRAGRRRSRTPSSRLGMEAARRAVELGRAARAQAGSRCASRCARR